VAEGGVKRAGRWSILAGLATLFIVLGYLGAGEWGPGSTTPATLVVPGLSHEAQAGREAFDRLCSACHGASASGSAAGPPLVHRIYGPVHHGDAAFILAAQRGVRAHHWRFGDMPAQPSARVDEISLIVRYVRELQRANGIE
jgi:mono/diheme cytochrome c family protein